MKDTHVPTAARLLLPLLAAALVACGGNDLVLPNGQAAALEIVRGEGQTGLAGDPLRDSLVVRVVDAEGQGVRGVVVSWRAEQGGSVSPATVATDADGLAAALRTLGPVPGPYSTVASVDAAEVLPATFTSLAGARRPASAEVHAGDGQTAPVAEAVPVAPAVLVLDEDGAPVAGATVVFAATRGGGSVSGASQTTGIDGIAAVGAWTLGSVAGRNELEATVLGGDVAGSPVTFVATAVAGGPSSERTTLEVSPPTITASAGSSASTLTATVRDALGNPVPGVRVEFEATGAGNLLTQPAGPTDASGRAVGRLSATGAGVHVVSLLADGRRLGQQAEVTVVPAPVSAARSELEVPDGEAGSPTTITVRLRDAFGNPVGGLGSSLQISVEGVNPFPSLTAVEAQAGTYTSSYTPTRTGADQVHARVAGVVLADSPAGSTVRAGPADPGTSTATVPSSGSIFTPVEVVVQTRDAFANPLGRGGETVRVTLVVGSSRTDLSVTDRGDGSYVARFTPQSVSQHRVEAALNGVPLPGSPYPFQPHF